MKMIFLDAATLGDASLEPLERFGTLVIYPTSTPEEAMERVADADILIVNKVKVTSALMDKASNLKLICEAATGVNNIDLDAASARGIKVRNVVAYSTDSVVQLTFTHILNLFSDSFRFDETVKNGRYSGSGIFTDVSSPYTEIAGKTIGIIGMGNIGSKVASVATAFGMNVIYYSTSGTSHCKDYPSVSLDELLEASDIISVHCPLNAGTNGLIGRNELRKMKRNAIIVNMARGGIIDEAAIPEAIDERIIAGAAFDVFSKEPMDADNPLLHIKHKEKVRFTPHVGWASAEAIGRLIEGIAVNIENHINGK